MEKTSASSALDPDAIRERVRQRYAAAAEAVSSGGDCCDGPCGCAGPGQPDDCGPALYQLDTLAGMPDSVLRASLGCGNPTAVAQLQEGEVVLDLGSGGGIDVLLSARRVGPTGKAYGLDMTEEMLQLARANAVQAGAGNAEFLHGTIEQVPLPDATVDVVLSNCVINLSVDKPAVLREAFRVLKPGGRLAVSDVVAEDWLSPADRAARGSYVGCIAGALTKAEYRAGLRKAGFREVSIETTHRVAEDMDSAIIRARKIAGQPTS
ncbi:MAG: arsenite methyltransferase [Candidatus Dormibacteria bacterium]